jgi:ATP-binding cassette subfamily B protein
MSLGVLIAFVNLVAMFYAPFQDISEKYTMLQSAMAGAERIFALLDTNDSIPDRPGAVLDRPIEGRIEFDDVRFRLQTGRRRAEGRSLLWSLERPSPS